MHAVCQVPTLEESVLHSVRAACRRFPLRAQDKFVLLQQKLSAYATTAASLDCVPISLPEQHQFWSFQRYIHMLCGCVHGVTHVLPEIHFPLGVIACSSEQCNIWGRSTGVTSLDWRCCSSKQMCSTQPMCCEACTSFGQTKLKLWSDNTNVLTPQCVSLVYAGFRGVQINKACSGNCSQQSQVSRAQQANAMEKIQAFGRPSEAVGGSGCCRLGCARLGSREQSS